MFSGCNVSSLLAGKWHPTVINENTWHKWKPQQSSKGQSSYLRAVSLQFCGRKIRIFVEKGVFAIVKLEKKRDKIQRASQEKQ